MNDQYYYSIESDCDACITSFVEELKNFQAQLTDAQEMMITVNDCSFRLERLRHEHNVFVLYLQPIRFIKPRFKVLMGSIIAINV